MLNDRIHGVIDALAGFVAHQFHLQLPYAVIEESAPPFCPPNLLVGRRARTVRNLGLVQEPKETSWYNFTSFPNQQDLPGLGPRPSPANKSVSF